MRKNTKTANNWLETTTTDSKYDNKQGEESTEADQPVKLPEPPPLRRSSRRRVPPQTLNEYITEFGEDSDAEL